MIGNETMKQFRFGATTEIYEEFRRTWEHQSCVREHALSRCRRAIRTIAFTLLISRVSAVYYFLWFEHREIAP